MQMKNRINKPESRHKSSTLKSASGAGFTFEDKAVALLFCEMLTGKSSLGAESGNHS